MTIAHIKLRQLLTKRERANFLQASKVVALFNVDHLKSMPICKRTAKWPTHPKVTNYKHHFYRQATHVLG